MPTDGRSRDDDLLLRDIESEARGVVSMTTSPWRAMGDMRNFVVHAYHRVDPIIIWRTATVEIPRLLEAIESHQAADRWPRGR